MKINVDPCLLPPLSKGEVGFNQVTIIPKPTYRY